MIDPEIAKLRREYHGEGLIESEMASHPMHQFRQWFEQAQQVDFVEVNAMTLATVDESGQANARIVLMKSFDDDGLVFFTNYQSRKGRNIAHDRRASALFFWDKLERQVRLEGDITQTDRQTTEQYFASRPRGSQLGAWVSEQSQQIESRQTLEQRLREVEARFGDGPIPAPPHWGGYLLQPRYVEFWQGSRNRLHDRIVYQRDEADGPWQMFRLSP